MQEFTYHGCDDCPLHATVVGEGPALVLLHGGGPDHHSMRPLADRLADRYSVVLPDIRGYGRSTCADPACHTWAQYTADIVSVLDAIGTDQAGLIGAGLGGTIALRTCLKQPDLVSLAVLISAEDIEDDQAKAAETALMDEFAERVRIHGIEAAWQLFLPTLQPLIGNLVRDAIPRSDPASIAAAAAIGRDRAFRSVEELKSVHTPTLIIPGSDDRHPTALAERLARALPRGHLAAVSMSPDLHTADDLAVAFAPTIRAFLQAVFQ